ncbi:MAG: hypothetical protein IJL72_02930 [Lachnospiraceae bacterium]|nr:hypothetical protein [Lachnospiraceae bacterium]
MNYKRLTLLAGHYGSGKTNLAVNMALDLRKTRERVALADLDIVNPYFRSKDSGRELMEAGVRLIVSEYANTNLDIPALPQEMYALIDDPGLSAVIDVGGDDRGALALGRLSPAIAAENDYDMFLVVNRFRPLTRSADDVLQVMREIEEAGHLAFTGVIDNSNLGAETSPEDVLGSAGFAEAVAEKTGLPLVLTSVDEALYPALSGKIENLFPMHLQKRPV